MDTTKLRPYLVVPKLIEQPTWGGTYIAESKKWQDTPTLAGKKIGQSYELYDKSNLSFAKTSQDPQFVGEIADNKSVEQQSVVPHGMALSDLIALDPSVVLGKRNVSAYGATMHLLLKFTQALGNSFQLHIPDGVKNDHWKPKPESWYYFEPGLITCGVRKDADWGAYEGAVTKLDTEMQAVAARVRDGSLRYEDAKPLIAQLVKDANPWQYVNVLRVEKGTLIDLSPCGIHHSWEEDLAAIPLGNVLYEIQLNVMDDVATLRSFDKGKMSKDGKLRSLQIAEYFTYADRSPAANDPKTHMREAKNVTKTEAYTHDRILETKYYSMDRITFARPDTTFESAIDTFRHIFVKSGGITVTAGETPVTVTSGHSVFIPAGCQSYKVVSSSPDTEILISY
jgi:mannose-6-phosphate isomerase class I